MCVHTPKKKIINVKRKMSAQSPFFSVKATGPHGKIEWQHRPGHSGSGWPRVRTGGRRGVGNGVEG